MQSTKSARQRALAAPVTLVLLFTAVVFTITGACGKKIPDREEQMKEMVVQKTNQFLRSFFTQRPHLKKKEPVAGLWIAEQKSLHKALQKKMEADPSLQPQDRVKLKERISSMGMFINISLEQWILLATDWEGNPAQPQQGKLLARKKVSPKEVHYKAALLGKTSDPKKNYIDVILKWKKTPKGEVLIYEDDNGTVRLTPETRTPDELFEQYKVGDKPQKDVVEF